MKRSVAKLALVLGVGLAAVLYFGIRYGLGSAEAYPKFGARRPVALNAWTTGLAAGSNVNLLIAVYGFPGNHADGAGIVTLDGRLVADLWIASPNAARREVEIFASTDDYDEPKLYLSHEETPKVAIATGVLEYGPDGAFTLDGIRFDFSGPPQFGQLQLGESGTVAVHQTLDLSASMNYQEVHRLPALRPGNYQLRSWRSDEFALLELFSDTDPEVSRSEGILQRGSELRLGFEERGSR